MEAICPSTIGRDYMADEDSHQNNMCDLRSMTLVTAGLPAIDLAKEEADEVQRSSLYEKTLRTDVINEAFLSRAKPWRKWVY